MLVIPLFVIICYCVIYSNQLLIPNIAIVIVIVIIVIVKIVDIFDIIVVDWIDIIMKSIIVIVYWCL